MPVSRQTPSRFGPSHCGQSSARGINTAKAPKSKNSDLQNIASTMTELHSRNKTESALGSSGQDVEFRGVNLRPTGKDSLQGGSGCVYSHPCLWNDTVA